MSNTVIKIENLSKQYRLGVWGSSTLRDEFARGWARLRGKEDPTLTIGSANTLDTVDENYVWALKDINLEVKQGEVLGIIGKNGAGKSTLLKILSRVTSPTTGSIKVKGRIASLLEVGTGMHQEMTGRENIFLNGAILGMTKWEIKDKFDEIVNFAGIAKYVDTPIKRFSSGMGVRLGFAIAAFLDPEILIVDEVLAVGDAEFQKKAIGKMQDVSKGEGRTVLFVSHNMDSIQKLTEKCVILQKGQILFEGATVSAVNFYLNEKKLVTDSKISLDDYPRNEKFGQKIKFSSIEPIYTKNNFTFNIGEPIEFIFRITCLENIDSNLRIGITILDFNLTPILSATSDHFFHSTKGKKIVVQFSINNLNIAPGIYHMSFSLGKGALNENREEFDVLPNILSFEVQNSGCKEEIMYNWSSSYGFMHHREITTKLIDYETY